MKILRYAGAAAIVLVTAAAVHRGPWRDYRCNVEAKRLRDRLALALGQPSSYAQLDAARAIISGLQPCVERDPADYQTLFLLGYAYRMTGNTDRALEMYEQALRVNERPEFLTEIGLIHLERGNIAEARRHLLPASYFTIETTGKVSMPLAEELYGAAEARLRRLRGQPERQRAE